jgi:hypothetical protein
MVAITLIGALPIAALSMVPIGKFPSPIGGLGAQTTAQLCGRFEVLWIVPR